MRGVAAMVDEFLTALDLDDVVLVGNDTAARSPRSSPESSVTGSARWC